MLQSSIQVAPAVATALADGRPVVALETAVVTHGLARPQNLSVVLQMVTEVEAAGAVAAVIGVVAGRVVVGLAGAELEAFANNDAVQKLSARDLAWAVATGATGGTTVAGTLGICRKLGIRMFATGGIGGVHRQWSSHLDISADLVELARTPCCVVSAGAKSVLDLPATLEALESHSVSVVGWRTDWFPQFHSRGHAGLPVPRRVDDLETAARLCQTRWSTLEQGGVLLAQAIAPADALPQERVDRAVELAVSRAATRGIRGPAITPFLLAELETITQGASVQANLALLRANARLAGQLAVAYAGLPA